MRLKAAAAAAAGGDSDSGAAAPGAEENERSIAALSLHDGEEEGEDVGGARGDGERRVTVDWAVSMPVRPVRPFLHQVAKVSCKAPRFIQFTPTLARARAKGKGHKADQGRTCLQYLHPYSAQLPPTSPSPCRSG